VAEYSANIFDIFFIKKNHFFILTNKSFYLFLN
jgi:hypothetical protein